MPMQETSAITASVLDTGSIPVASIAYLAGMIDADGSISIVKNRNGFKPQVSISNSCKPMLEWCARVVDRTHTVIEKRRLKPNHSRNWDIKWTYNHAVAVARAVCPYLLIKREQAQCLVIWLEVRKRNGKYTDEELEMRDLVVARIKHLNRRGNPPDSS